MPAESEPVLDDVSRELPLDGLVVVDLSRYIAGPYCTMLMADAGATVIKVEPPAGDDTRHLGPLISDDHGSQVSAYFIRMNRGKRSIVIDLKTQDGRAELAGLIRSADVLVENYAPGVLDHLGFPTGRLRELNPALVYCSISGFGHTASPMKDRAAYNIVAEYEAGVFHRQGPDGTPGPLGPPVGDTFPSLHALGGLMVALYRREKTGLGGHVDIAMYDSMLSFNEIRSTYELLYGRAWDPTAHPFYAPYGVFRVRDGHIAIDVTTPAQWRGFCRAVGAPELADIPGLDTGPERVAQFDRLIRGPLERWLATQNKEDAVDLLAAQRVPAAVIRSPGEALTSAQAAARQMTVTASGSGVSLTTAGNPITIDAPRRPPCGHAPDLNADRPWVLQHILGRAAAAAAKTSGR